VYVYDDHQKYEECKKKTTLAVIVIIKLEKHPINNSIHSVSLFHLYIILTI